MKRQKIISAELNHRVKIMEVLPQSPDIKTMERQEIEDKTTAFLDAGGHITHVAFGKSNYEPTIQIMIKHDAATEKRISNFTRPMRRTRK